MSVAAWCRARESDCARRVLVERLPLTAQASPLEASTRRCAMLRRTCPGLDTALRVVPETSN
jgi:hypothetical protein